MLIVTLLILALALATAEQLSGVDGAFRRALIEGPARYLNRRGPLQWIAGAGAILAVLGLLVVAPEMVMVFGVVDLTALMDVAILLTMVGVWKQVRTAAVAAKQAARRFAARSPARVRTSPRERTTLRPRGLKPPEDPEPAWRGLGFAAA